MRRQHGFTLIEVMVTVILTGLVVTAVVGLYSRMSRNYDALSAIGDTQQNLRAVRTMMAREVRAAGANPMGMVMAGGRIWFPQAADCSAALPMAGPQMGCEFWLGFNFKDNWADGGTSTLSDPIFVSYAVQPQVITAGDFPPQLVASVDPGPTFDGVTLDADPPAEVEVGDFAMLTNGYHACVVEITGVNVAARKVDFDAGVNLNPANGLSDYCLPFQTSGPGAGTNAGALPGQTYCAWGGASPERRCYLLDMQTVRLRRFYIWPIAGGDRELRLESAVGATRLAGGGADLLGTGVTQEILVRGMEDMQVSYSLLTANGNSPGLAFPDPPLTFAETDYQAAGKAFDYHTNVATCVDGCDPTCPADTSDCRGECVPGDGDCPANPDSPQDEARWLDQVTITMLARTRSRLPGGLGGEAGLKQLNPAWGAAQPAQASSFLRRTLRVEVDMRNYVRAW